MDRWFNGLRIDYESLKAWVRILDDSCKKQKSYIEFKHIIQHFFCFGYSFVHIKAWKLISFK